ncbi:MAG: SGNH/GDSL hydrolase family protein [Lachnospiraceae bacterium]|nr:SGNH/GDSL hydrolase family protein [Lachnospiraceae bacterium]
MENTAKRGPKAPKDPTKKRSVIYIMLDDAVEGRPNERGGFSEVNFLEGRVAAKTTNLLPELDKDLAARLQTCEGFRDLVHSIGVSMKADKEADREKMIQFAQQCRTATGYNGTRYATEVVCNGKESIITVADYEAVEGETVLASFHIEFPSYFTGKLTVAYYLNDGYEVPELIPDPPVQFDSAEYKKMVERSCMHVGNLYRMKRAIARARAGEDVTIAYIGGSITQGAGAKPIATECYAYRSYEAFKQRFGKGDGSNVHFIKAGVGGTPSELGLTRYEDDVLRQGSVVPDVVVIEFAVNDAGDETNGVCYESLALMAMEGPGNPAVVLLFSVFMDDYNLQENLSKVGFHYDLPMVSVKNAVTPQFYEETPVITKRQFFYDLYHPSNDGHRIQADCLAYFWQLADESATPAMDVDLTKDGVIGNRYRGLRAFGKEDAGKHEVVKGIWPGSFTGTDTALQCVEQDDHAYATPEFPDHWMYAPETGENSLESFRMTIECKDLLLVYKDSGDVSFGTAEVLVDGVVTRTINPLEVGWNHCNAVIIHSGDVCCEHTVEIRMAAGFEQKKFTILGFGYTVK